MDNNIINNMDMFDFSKKKDNINISPLRLKESIGYKDGDEEGIYWLNRGDAWLERLQEEMNEWGIEEEEDYGR